MPGLFAGTSLERPVTCERCELPMEQCRCPRDASGRVLLPQQQTAVVALDKKRKGKVVTTVSGLDPSATDLAGLLKTLKSSCGAGGTLNQSTTETQMEIQGDQRERVAQQLRAMGYTVKVK